MKRSGAWAIGVDIGGTKLAAGLVLLPQGEVQARQQIPTVPVRGGEVVFEDVRGLCEELAAVAKAQDHNIDCIGVGVCELVDPARNVISENCVAWKDVPVQAGLSWLTPTV